ncbi:beta-ketoacyl synthase N-terminal-like domain-containing protein [Cupriavidus campinensis]|jgi:hypothetical protein
MSAVNLLTCAAVAPGIGEDLLPCSPGTLAIVDPDWFDPALWLPGTRHRYLNDTTRYALAAARRCPDPCTDGRVAPERLALCFGTSVADVSVRHLFDQAVAHGGLDAVSTVSAPNISANIAAAHVAIDCQARALCSTVTSPFLAGFEALMLGIQAIQAGRADQSLVIAAEEAIPDGAGAAILPGAVALRLGGRATENGHCLRPLGWGRVETTGQLPQRLVHALTRTASGFPGPTRFVVPARTPLSWPKGLPPPDILTCDDAGALAPLLCALPTLRDDSPFILVAIHEHRYMAFVSQCRPLSTQEGAHPS